MSKPKNYAVMNHRRWPIVFNDVRVVADKTADGTIDRIDASHGVMLPAKEDSKPPAEVIVPAAILDAAMKSPVYQRMHSNRDFTYAPAPE